MEVSTGAKQEVTMDLLRCGTLNLSLTKGWRVGERSIFNLEFGYAIALANKSYVIKDGSTLSATSQTVMKLLQPGGTLLGASFMFGLK
jgi:hypothetical protein